jgi:hypothetical protein
MKIRNTLEGVGAALLLLIPYYCKFLLPTHLEIYHLRLPVTNLMGGLLLDLLAYSILAIGFLIAVQYLPPRARRVLEAVFVGFILWSSVDFAWMMLIHLRFPILMWQLIWEHGVLAIPLLLGLLAYFFPRGSQPVVRTVRLAMAGFAFSALWIVPQLLRLALVSEPAVQAASVHLPAPGFGNADRRIVWILFDELSYDQTFDHRASEIQLPNFDRLRDKSVSFSRLKPAGYYTDRIIPSLFLGRRIDQIRSTIDGELQYRDETQGRWVSYDPQATLFGLAQQNEWNTGIDGWYSPYCRILAPVVDTCSWEPDRTLIEQHGASEEKPALANAVAMPTLLGDILRPSTLPREAQIEVDQRMIARAQALIGDARIRFVFVHLAIPHPRAVYDRRSHILRPSGDYLDNLVLADDTLSVLMKEIDASPAAARTIVLVTSDHSWRVPLWRPLEDWTDEEERASSGKFDDRPVLLVHFPGQKSNREISTELPEMLEHDMIAGMLLGQIENPEDLDAFLMRQDNTQSGKQTVSMLGSGH